MSATIGWVPCSKGATSFESNYDSAIRETIIKSFGNPIKANSIVKLRHFAEATGEEIYTEIADIIEKFGDIEIKIEW